MDQFKTIKIKPSNEMNEFKFELGTEAQDKITGFRGTITCRAQYHLGMNQYRLSAPGKKGSDPIELWFQEPRVTNA